MVCQVNYVNPDKKLQCQYNEPPDFEFDGHQWCWLHLPINNDKVKSAKEKQAQDETHNFNEKIVSYIKTELEKGNKEIDLSHTVFPSAFSFTQALDTFDKPEEITLNFSHCKFYGQIDVISKNKSPLPKLNFKKVGFYSRVQFVNCDISSSDFSEADFYVLPNFMYSYFSDCIFIKTIFHDGARFISSQFGAFFSNECALFDEAKFFKVANFFNTIFSGKTTFRTTEFHGTADFSFEEMMLDPKENHQLAERFNEIDFSGSTFSTLKFTNRKFLSKTNFSNCIFNKAPIFHGCEFHQYTLFPNIRNFRDTSSEESASAYRTLNIAMTGLKARREEAMFYSLEQESLKNCGKFNWIDYIISSCYKYLSNYGQSIGKPLGWLFLVSSIAFLFYGIAITPLLSLKANIDSNILNESFWTTIYQIVKPFSINEFLTRHQNHISHDGWVKLIATLQSLLSIIFITLLLLAIRWKFKRD